MSIETGDSFGGTVRPRYSVLNGGGLGVTQAWYRGDGTEALRIANDGNVGFGSTVPGTKLDVSGTVRATAFSGNGSALTGLPATGGWTLGASNVGISTTNNVGIGTSLTTTAGLTVMNGNIGIGTWVPTAALEIQGGNLGIGTINAHYKLEIVPPAGSTAARFYGGAAATPTIIVDDVSPTGNGGISMRMGGVEYGRVVTSGSMFIDAVNANDLYLRSVGDVVIRAGGLSTTVADFLSTGKVGFGTTSPGSQFSVLGGASV